MRNDWMTDPVFWLFALPATVASGLLIQMILSFFSCCGTFTLQGKSIHLKWWMIPATSCLCGILWMIAVGSLFL